MMNTSTLTTIANRLGYLFAFVAALLTFSLSASAFAANADPTSRTADVTDISKLPQVTVGSVSVDQRLSEDAAKTEPGPLRYAIPADMSINPDNAGTWETLKDGSQLWRYRVHARGATDLNFGFTKYHLPPGATLHVISESQDYFHGPYTSKDNQEHGQHWTPMVPGESAIVELFVPAKQVNNTELRLELGRVGMGYRDMMGKPNMSRQGACNIDTICPQGDNWRDDIRSANQYSFGGGFICSGTLIMDVPGTFQPWYISATHCGLNAGNAPSLVMFWNYESAVCGDLSGGIADDAQTGGGVWRAARVDADFTLVQLNTQPDPSFGVYYAGWDATGAVPPSSVGISHPSNDEKALAFNDDPLGTSASCIGGPGTPGTHWTVDNYEEGMTEPGSSGSGIWNTYSTDPYNPVERRLVGVLSGGGAACAGGVPNNLGDCYGKFSVAWNGPSASTRLSDWLDPGGTGTLIVDGADPMPAVCGDSTTGAGEQCDDGNTANGDGCSSACAIETGFSCSNPPDGPSVCSPIACGNGFVETGEQCDDGDLDNGDGCSSACEVEAGFSCTAPVDGPSVCMVLPEGCSTPNSAIPDDNTAGLSDGLTLSGGALTDLDVTLDIQHTYVGDLVVTLTNESTGTTITLLDRPGLPAINPNFGCGNDNIDATLDDAAGTAAEDQCSATPPAIGGTHAPTDALAAFNGESAEGTWTLNVSDNEGQDTGTLVEWCLNATSSSIDTDGDGVSDDADNCTLVINADQRDTNGDGYGNACDPDINNDGVVNFIDISGWTPLFNSACGDVDEDFNGDGNCNFSDFSLFPEYFLQPPGPSGVAP